MMTAFSTAPNQSADISGARLVFREIGPKSGVPLILLHHLTAVLEDWDPRIVDGLAAERRVVIFDNRGVGASSGVTPDSVEEMARDVAAFVAALGYTSVDLFGFSLGGFVAQSLAHQRPDLVRKIMLAGTGPAGGEGIVEVGPVLQHAFGKAAGTNKHPKHFLFFTQTHNGQAAADAFLLRLKERTDERDTEVSEQTVQAQLTAIQAWGRGDPAPLARIQQPVLIANGDRDIMVPSINSFELLRRLPNAQLSVFPDAGHGGIFQYHSAFVQQALSFLRE